MLRFLELPVEASAHATSIDQIIVIVHWLMLVMFVGWSARVDAFHAERQATVVRVVAEQFRSRIPHPGLQPQKNGGVPGAGTPPMEDRLRRCGAVADVAVDYFFVPFVASGLADATCFGAAFAAARVTLSAILWPLSSL